MKTDLVCVLMASILAMPAWAGNVQRPSHGASVASTAPTPSSTSSSSATGGAGGAGGTATGGAATGGSATGGNATGGASNVNVSVLNGSGSSSAPGAAAVGEVGTAGSSAYNTKATVDYGGSYEVKNVPGVVSPSLTTTLSDTCMGSVSLGVSAVGFGLSGGVTMVDEACVRRLDSREFRAMGMNDVALALLCQSEANRKAVEATGRFCPSPQPQNQGQGNATAYPVTLQPDTERYSDPIVRKRMGLQPLPDLSAVK
ncbi:histidine kinase [uncultured Oxalicibacterium sp.]|uniref:histidine kinase n=1 Tax=uncultured Oxalicibacterium sp. TaxID=1168540 RepID=UPI0025E112D1|nr:histidine kinase [uncultured Oxalicibacterium sp.]